MSRSSKDLAAALAAILVKEDAVLPLFAASVALGLNRFRSMNRVDRAVLLVVPVALALANLGIYYSVVVPALTTNGLPAYAAFWASYGPTPMRALVGMITHPGRVLMESVRSGFFQTVMMNGAPHGPIVNDDKRMIDWIPDGDIKLRPRTFTAVDAAALIASGDLFARKFDAEVDSKVLDILEAHLLTQDAANVDAAAPALPREAALVVA